MVLLVRAVLDSAFLLYMVWLPFKRNFHYVFVVFLTYELVGAAGVIWIGWAPDAATFASEVWWSFAFSPALGNVILSTVVFLYLYPRPTRNQKLKIILPYSWLTIYEILVFTIGAGALWKGARNTPTGWAFTPGWLRNYFTFFGFPLGFGNAINIILVTLIVAEIYRYYRVQNSPVAKRRLIFLSFGLEFWCLMGAIASGLILYTGSVVIWALQLVAADSVLLVSLMRPGFYKVIPLTETSTMVSNPPIPQLEKGQSYLGIESTSSLRIFSDYLKTGKWNGLCITRSPPGEVRAKFGLEVTPIKWLAGSDSKDAIDPDNLAGITKMVAYFMQKADRPIVLLDGLDYLVSLNGFKSTMSFIDRVNKLNAMKGGIFIAASSGISTTDSGQKPAVWKTFEEAPLIQARIKALKTVEMEETFQYQLDLFNVGRRPVHIDRVNDVIPPEFKVVDAMGNKLEGSSLVMGGRRLEPFQLESTLLLVQAIKPGDFTISGRVAYRDGKAIQSSHVVEPLRVKVVEPQDFEFETKEAKEVFSYLGREFISDYMLKRQVAADSGWRTLLQVSRSTAVPQSTLYGEHGRYGRPVHELISRGLVEERRFAGGKGPTGETTRFRLAYDRDAVRHYVDRMIAKPK